MKRWNGKELSCATKENIFKILIAEFAYEI